MNRVKTRHQLSGNNEGSVNITGLSVGNYHVREFDQLEDHIDNRDPAYVHNELLAIILATTAAIPVNTL